MRAIHELKIPAQNDRAATNPTQNPSTYTVVSFQFTTNSIFPVQPTLSRSLHQKFPIYRFLTARVHINLDTRSEMECSALGFSWVRRKPSNGQLAKMGSFHQSKRLDNKWSIFCMYLSRIQWFSRGIYITA